MKIVEAEFAGGRTGEFGPFEELAMAESLAMQLAMRCDVVGVKIEEQNVAGVAGADLNSAATEGSTSVRFEGRFCEQPVRIPIHSIAYNAERCRASIFAEQSVPGGDFVTMRAREWRLLLDLIRVSAIAAERAE